LGPRHSLGGAASRLFLPSASLGPQALSPLPATGFELTSQTAWSYPERER